MPRVAQAVVGGWKTNGVWRISAGRPLGFQVADGISLPTYGTQRPNLAGKPKRNTSPDWIDNNFFANPEVFLRPDDYTLGTAPRTMGDVRSPKSSDVDLSLEKDFSLESLRKGMSAEFRIEAQNAFNHPVFGSPSTSVDSDDFGLVTYTANGPREVQLGLKISF